MVDGRLGYPPDKKSYTQFDPKPVPSLRSLIGQHYVVKAASAGDRHTLILMIRLHRDIAYTNPHTSIVSEQRSKKLMMVGLNQQGLCEEPGFNQAVEIECETVEDPPVHLVAGKGNSFYVTRRGKIFSFGVGRYGILGHGDDVTNQVPRLIKGMSREFVLKLSVGDSHALALIEGNGMYSWGRNHKGQLGRSFESPFEAQPHQVVLTALKNGKYRIEDVACGENHSIILVAVTGRENVVSTLIYGWGDESRGQLGSGDVSTRCRPMENRMFSRLIKKSGVKISKIAAGGNHNLALTKYGGQVISWGAGDYGQLGSGECWMTRMFLLDETFILACIIRV